jgi:hypothetical protein
VCSSDLLSLKFDGESCLTAGELAGKVASSVGQVERSARCRERKRSEVKSWKSSVGS